MAEPMNKEERPKGLGLASRRGHGEHLELNFAI